MPFTLHQSSPYLGTPHPRDIFSANALYWSLFGDDTGWGIPKDCLPNRRGYPWANLVRTYGLPTIREMFKQGNLQACPLSYQAEIKFASWCKRNGYHWTMLEKLRDWKECKTCKGFGSTDSGKACPDC